MDYTFWQQSASIASHFIIEVRPRDKFIATLHLIELLSTGVSTLMAVSLHAGTY